MFLQENTISNDGRSSGFIYNLFQIICTRPNLLFWFDTGPLIQMHYGHFTGYGVNSTIVLVYLLVTEINHRLARVNLSIAPS